MQELIKKIFDLSDDIRYVAVYHQGELATSVRQDLAGASSSESDKYEELIVNPTLLMLVKQRGDIDCGGSKFVLVRYGNFYQFVVPMEAGHISVCIEPTTNPLELTDPIIKTLSELKHFNE